MFVQTTSQEKLDEIVCEVVNGVCNRIEYNTYTDNCIKLVKDKFGVNKD